MSHRENRSSIVRQEEKGNALNNAGEREFDINDEHIELTAAFTLQTHDATRNRSMTRMSRHAVSSGPSVQ